MHQSSDRVIRKRKQNEYMKAGECSSAESDGERQQEHGRQFTTAGESDGQQSSRRSILSCGASISYNKMMNRPQRH